MIKKLIRKVLDRLFLRKFDDIKIQKGQIFERHLELNLEKIKKLNQVYFKVFSQDYEDGIIKFLLKILNITNVRFVEIGTQDYSESNTRYIFETMRCEGLIIDPTPNLKNKIKSFMRLWKNNLKIHNDYINANNINQILKENNFEKNIDLFSLDIDGIDYWVLEKIPDQISKIFIIEYNPYFGSDKEVVTPNIEKFDRFNYHPSGICWGASLKSIIKLMEKKGYKFIGSNELNCNSFFVRNDLIKKIKIDFPNTDNLSKFTDYKFNVAQKINNNLQNLDEIQHILDDIEVFDLKNKKIKKFKFIDQKD